MRGGIVVIIVVGGVRVLLVVFHDVGCAHRPIRPYTAATTKVVLIVQGVVGPGRGRIVESATPFERCVAQYISLVARMSGA